MHGQQNIKIQLSHNQHIREPKYSSFMMTPLNPPGYAAQLFGALRHKPEGRWFNVRCGQRNFSLTFASGSTLSLASTQPLYPWE